MLLAHELLPAMIERRSGHLLFVSSLSGKAASPRASVYNATKFGLRGFALALREDLAGDNAGVGVSLVLPGFIRAGMFADPSSARNGHVELRGGRGRRRQGDRAGTGPRSRSRRSSSARSSASRTSSRALPRAFSAAVCKIADKLARGQAEKR